MTMMVSSQYESLIHAIPSAPPLITWGWGVERAFNLPPEEEVYVGATRPPAKSVNLMIGTAWGPCRHAPIPIAGC